jgi:hypothetical protein
LKEEYRNSGHGYRFYVEDANRDILQYSVLLVLLRQLTGPKENSLIIVTPFSEFFFLSKRSWTVSWWNL